jgi:nucleoside 2-deoxyribosyltransferase
MNIYFSCSITGGRNDQQVYEAIVNALLEDGHEVPTAILASDDVMALEKIIQPEEVYLRDVAWVEGCDVLIAEVSTPSHGVGYEIALALSLGKPVFCCYQKDRQVSKMILGNNHPRIRLAAYNHSHEAVNAVRNFLRNL